MSGFSDMGSNGSVSLSIQPRMTPDEQRSQYEAAARQHRVNHAESRPKSRAGAVLLGLLLFFLLGLAAMVLVLRHAGTAGFAGRLATTLLGRSTAFDTTAPVVVEQIQKLNRLETVSYSVDTVVEGKRSSAVLPDALFGDKLLLIVHGQVVAGIDLARLKPESVVVQGRSVSVELPPSEIFSTRIDENKSRVFARETGLFVPTDPNLETETRRTAESQILTSAQGDGILDTARSNGRASIESLLHGLGFQQVTVR